VTNIFTNEVFNFVTGKADQQAENLPQQTYLGLVNLKALVYMVTKKNSLNPQSTTKYTIEHTLLLHTKPHSNKHHESQEKLQ